MLSIEISALHIEERSVSALYFLQNVTSDRLLCRFGYEYNDTM